MSAPSEPSSVQPGRAFGKYVIKRVIAEGGMAIVYEATHATLGHRVAIKLLSRHLLGKPDIVARFEREARSVARLESPYVARVVDVDTSTDGRPYIVMEYLEGRDLEDEIRARGALPIGDAIAYMIEACAAVSTAHRAGIVHRDLKPANIYIANEGQRKIVKVLDFGISKVDSPQEISATSTATMLGTPLYMSPEQVRSARDVDGRTDIWSLGVVLYEVLTGQLPFFHEDASGVIAAIVADPCVPVGQLRQDLPPPLAAAIMKALEKDRNQRFRTIEEFAAALLPFAPPWFHPPRAVTERPMAPALPAHLTNSLAEALENDRTVADPNFAPNALQPYRPEQPMPFIQPPMVDQSQVSPVARTTAGGTQTRGGGATSTKVLAAIGVGAICGALLFAVFLGLRSYRASTSALPTTTATQTSVVQTASIASAIVTAPPTTTITTTATITPSVSAVAPIAPQAHGNGKLDVTMSGDWCTVRIDNKEEGPTPIANREIAAGSHTITCTTNAGAVKRQVVQIVPNETAKVKFAP